MSLRDEHGFGLIELLVVMTISIVLLSATLVTFNSFYQSDHDNNARLDNVEAARNALDVQARQLRNLAKRPNSTTPVIDTASSYDLIFQTSDPTRTWARYCLDTTTAPASVARGRLWTQELVLAPSAGATPITGPMRTGCPAASGWTTTKLVTDYVTNRIGGQDRPLFTYTCTSAVNCTPTPAIFDQIVNINAQTIVDTKPSAGGRELSVVSGVYLRNQNQAPVASFAWTPASATRTVALNGSGSSDYEGRTLSYYWFEQSMPTAIDCKHPIATGSPSTFWGAPPSALIGTTVTLSYKFPAASGASGTSRNIGLVVCDPGDLSGTAGITSSIPVTIPN